MTAEEFAGYAKRYGDTVYRVALNCCKNAADAEHVKRWLIRVAVNEGRKLRSSGWFKRRASLEEYAGTVDFESPEESELFIIVMALPEKYRVPLYLYYYEDYTIKEVAALCKLKESTVQTRLQRARERVKKALTKQEEDS